MLSTNMEMPRKLSTCEYDNLKLDVEEKPPDEVDFFWMYRVAGFGASSPRKWISRLGFVMMSIVALTAVFELAYVLFHIMWHSKFSVKYASYPVSFGWISQLTMNMIIFFYFYYKNVFDSQFVEIIQIPGSMRIIRKVKYMCWILTIGVFVFSGCILVATHFNNDQSVVFNYNDVFQYKYAGMFFRLLTYYKILILLVMQFYYLNFTGILCFAFNNLNKKFKECLNSSKNSSNEETARLLHSFFLDHLRLSKKLRLLDRTYGVGALIDSIPINFLYLPFP
ncbi:hypothetical protein M3Y97_00994900 [Aphelenchoides bicaudatus]|nr:hypothetical protein M3Y97_00994900 [Aphelenchoides bicaudatus]